MSFLNDYLFYNEGNECHRNYHLWAGLSLLATIIGRRVAYIDGGDNAYGQLEYHPHLYICLVGPQGGRKSFAKDGIRNILLENFPDTPMSYSVDTREAIWEFMGSDEAARSYTNPDGVIAEYRPMLLIINELKNFLSVNAAGMIDFIVDIHDCKVYSSRTKNKGTSEIVNPCLNILACATTEYIIDQLRDKILSGGLSRRMVFVNVSEELTRKASPEIPTGGKEAISRAIKHLHKLRSTVHGRFKWRSDKDYAEYKHWYETVKYPNDPLMRGFYRSKHVQVVKVMMLLAVAEYDVKLEFTIERFQLAKAIIDAIEPGMEKLFASAGRNELAVPQQKILELIDRSGGLIAEKELLKFINKDLGPAEQQVVLNFLGRTDQLVRKTYKPPEGIEKIYYFLPEKITELDKLNIKV